MDSFFAAQGCDDDYMYLDADEYSEYDSIDDVPSEKVDFTFVIGCYEIISGKPHQKWCGF